MLKLNRKIEYGLVALKHMYNKPREELTSVREICDVYNTPFDPLAHVMRILNSEGVLKSEQGAHGGYRLVSDLSKINLAEFMEMIEGQLSWTDCMRKEDEKKCGIKKNCNIVESMQSFNKRLISFFRSIYLSDLLIEDDFHSKFDGESSSDAEISPNS